MGRGEGSWLWEEAGYILFLYSVDSLEKDVVKIDVRHSRAARGVGRVAREWAVTPGLIKVYVGENTALSWGDWRYYPT